MKCDKCRCDVTELSVVGTMGITGALTGVAPGKERRPSDKPVASALLLEDTSPVIGENMPSVRRDKRICVVV